MAALPRSLVVRLTATAFAVAVGLAWMGGADAWPFSWLTFGLGGLALALAVALPARPVGDGEQTAPADGRVAAIRVAVALPSALVTLVLLAAITRGQASPSLLAADLVDEAVLPFVWLGASAGAYAAAFAARPVVAIPTALVGFFAIAVAVVLPAQFLNPGVYRMEPFIAHAFAVALLLGIPATIPLGRARRGLRAAVGAVALPGIVLLVPFAGAAVGVGTGPYDGASAAPERPPASLPESVVLTTPTEGITHEYWVALREGRLWIRPNPETTDSDAPWRLLPPDGLPRHRDRSLGGAPPAIREISADGDNLIAIDEGGLVYYTKLSDFGWIDLWGPPPFGAPLRVDFDYRSMAVSHRGPLVGNYEDIDGNAFPISAGVSTLYALGANGRDIIYADPWLPAHFGRRIASPRRDRMIAVTMAASASTLAVVDAAGRTYTRLADWDSLGENPVLAYTWERGGQEPPASARVLPPEDWAEQPAVPGKITARLTILQTGHGNAGRELRIEGTDADGRGGYWRKAIRDPEWTFVETGAEVSGPFLANAASGLPAPAADALDGPSRARDLVATSFSPDLGDGVTVRLLDWNPDDPPARVQLGLEGATLEVPLHWRRPIRDREARVREALAALARPEGPVPAPLAGAVETLFGDARVIELGLTVDAEGRPTLDGGVLGLRAAFDAGQ